MQREWCWFAWSYTLCVHYHYTDILHDQRSFVEQLIAAKRPLSLVSRLTDQVTYHVIVTWYRCMYHTMLIVL